VTMARDGCCLAFGMPRVLAAGVALIRRLLSSRIDEGRFGRLRCLKVRNWNVEEGV
jgi:hypothetical protein